MDEVLTRLANGEGAAEATSAEGAATGAASTEGGGAAAAAASAALRVWLFWLLI